LREIDRLDVLVGQVVLAVNKGLKLVVHEVEDVEPGMKMPEDVSDLDTSA
jgi:hypothetical protein